MQTPREAELLAENERLRAAVQSQHADLISLADSHERLWLGIESIRDDCAALLDPTEGENR